MDNLFEIIDEKGTKYYGGDQSWYSSNTRALGGCGSVAGANVIRALVHKNRDLNVHVRKTARISPDIKRALLNRQPTKDDYELLMTDVYHVMGAVELFPLNVMYDRAPRDTKIYKTLRTNSGRSSIGFVRGMLKYAKRCNIALKSHMLPTAFCNPDKALSFIKEGIEKSGAVVILTSFNMHNLHMHRADGLYYANEDIPELKMPSYGSKDLNSANEESTSEEIRKPEDMKKQKKRAAFSDGGWNWEMKCHFATITDVIDKMGTPYLLITTWGKPAEVNFDELVHSWKSFKAYESSLFYFTSDESSKVLKGTVSAVIKFFAGIFYCFIKKNKSKRQ